MESEKFGPSGTDDEAVAVLEPALYGTGLVFAAVGAEPFSSRSMFQPRRARVRRIESLRHSVED